MECLEVPRPSGDGLCSDNECPCGLPGAAIPRGTGYLYMSREVVDYRRDARTVERVQRKVRRMEQQLDSMIVLGQGVASPILVCEEGAKLRGLDLEVAAADAKHWWETGLAPLRATPLSKKKTPPESTDSKGVQDLGRDRG